MKLDELVAGSTKSKDGAASKELHEDAGSGRLIECGRIWSEVEMKSRDINHNPMILS